MTTPPLFEIDELHVSTLAEGDQAAVEVLRDVSLTIGEGEIHALMGPSGSGKSTLASALMGDRGDEVTGGRILFRGDDITDWDTDVRAKVGMFLAFQHPQEFAGVSVLNFLRQSLSARKGVEMGVVELRMSLLEWLERLDMDESFLERHVNQGFSSQEKRRNEILQMAVLEPEFAILDETDSELDVAALRVVATGIQEIRKERPALGALVITRHQRLLEFLEPTHVHVLIDGRIVRSGGLELAAMVEDDRYESFS